jgi:2'-5' RNA ligase
MISVVRSFIAISLSKDLQSKIAQLEEALIGELGDLPVRWVPASNIHLTLKFLGDVSVNNVPMLQKIIQAEARETRPFEISVGGFGVFPNISRPRVLWLGVEAPEELISLQRRIEGEAARLGYAPDNRPFSPHLTLGRVSRSADYNEVRGISNALRSYKLGFIGAARIQQVHLFRSDLRPEGAVYTEMYTADFSS